MLIVLCYRDYPNLLSAGGDGYVQIWCRPQPEDENEDAMSVDGEDSEPVGSPSRRLEVLTDD